MKIGFIGCGNMATAMINGVLGSRLAEREDIMASAATEQTREKIRQKLMIGCGSNEEVASFGDIVVLAVKPLYYQEVCAAIAPCLRSEQVVVSLAPGKSLDYLAGMLGEDRKIVRAMPNTPALVGEGMSGLCASVSVTGQEAAIVEKLFESFGKAQWVPEHLMDVVTAVSGSSPAYIFLVIEAMADGAVALGMPRAQAYQFAAQAVLGSAKMVLESGEHPGLLKDAVCSPGGTTIEAVRILEQKGIRSAFMEAEIACAKKAGDM
ncbi:MAG: pyrroline-5-carboxylate reductase [Lachnospiraceae bacterium]|nr:pyrroline-5-carboxylate reductase [Lachnospiraceae bacterium]